MRAIQNFPFRAPGQNSVFTLVDSTLVGVGAASSETAILTEERFYAANVATPGYQRPVEYRQAGGFGALAGNQNLEGDFIEEYWSQGSSLGSRLTGGTHELFDGSPDGSLRLDIKDAPDVPLDPNLANWAKPSDFVTTNPDGTPSGIGGDRFDDSAAIQAAIDSGATTIYFDSRGPWVVDSTVQIRGNVERVIGLESTLASTTGDGVIGIGEGAPEAIVIERFAGRGAGTGVEIQHAGSSTLVARNLQGFDYRAVSEAPGDLFIYDIANGYYEFRNQDVWARQFNVEGRANVNDDELPDQKVLNDNANLWVLGMKIEQEGTVVRTINGGRSELLGVYRNNNNFSDADNPAFVTVDAATSVVNFDLATAASGAFAVWASETRNGVTRTSERFDTAHVYSAFDDADLWDVQQAIVIDNLDPEVTYTGTWSPSASLPGGFIDEDIAFSNDPDATATFTPDLPVAGTYEVFTRWIDNSGGQDHNGHSAAVPVTIDHADGSELLAIDQRVGGGKWVSAGTYSFDAGSAGSVVIATDGTNATSIADGVRFVLVDADGDVPTLSEPFPINPTTGELFDLAGVTARFVRLEIVDSLLPGAATRGLSEVQFRGERAAEVGSPEVTLVSVQDVSSDPNPDRVAERTLGVGLNETDNSLGTTRGHNWESAADDPTPSVTYDLNDLYELGSVRIWNYNHPGDLTRGAKTIDVYTSVDNVTFESYSTVSLGIGTGSSDDNGEKFDLNATTARYVRFDIVESHGATGNVGLGNVRFFGGALPAGDPLEVVSASTSNGNGAAGLINAINGSGLDDAAEFHGNAGGTRYTSNFDTTPTLDFSFGRVASVDKIHVWNHTQQNETDRGIREVRLLTSVDGVDYVDQGVYEIPRGSGSLTLFHAINFQLDPIVASDIRLEVISNWGDGSFTGLSEIRFFGNSLPDTPTSISLAASSDLGFFSDDNVTRLNNASPNSRLDFVVEGTQAGSTVVVFANDVAIGSAVATGDTTVVTTDGVTVMAD